MRKDIQIQDKIQQGKNGRGIDPYVNSVRQKKMVDCKHCCGLVVGVVLTHICWRYPSKYKKSDISLGN